LRDDPARRQQRMRHASQRQLEDVASGYGHGSHSITTQRWIRSGDDSRSVFHSCCEAAPASALRVGADSPGSTASKKSRELSIGKPIDGPGVLSSRLKSPALPLPIARAISNRRISCPELVQAGSVSG